MTITVTLSFQVPDYDVSKAAFLLDKTDRKEAGLHATPYRSLDDSNHVFTIGTAPSKEAFTTFFSNPELQERIKATGVVGPPDITFLEER